MPSDETIVAIATPPGRGGIGMVRISGARAFEIACAVTRLPAAPEPRRATLTDFSDPHSRRLLDQVMVTTFPAPHSYTGEDVVEVACHGAPVILGYLVECCLGAGARAAEPGEFTLRAFLNGRIDLTQAEAVRDLIESRTLYQARVAAEQLEGAVSGRIRPHKQALVNLIARLEAGIDFGEDDVPVSSWSAIEEGVDSIRGALKELAESFSYGRVVHDGLNLAIVGRPNVGKSSLFNRLLNQERAIVTAAPGTTRDLVTESAAIGGIPVRLVDTAGIREAADEAERIGVRKSLEAIADSDLRLLVVDGSQAWTEEDAALLEKLRPLGALLVACNKDDLPRGLSLPDVASSAVVWTSALTGEGVEELRQRILELAAPARDVGAEGSMITNLRHRQLLDDALAALDRASRAAVNRVHHEMLLLDLYDAVHALDTITGATTVDDVLGVIFSSFCVGK